MSAPPGVPTTYHRLLRIKRRLPEWLRYRLDPYNTAADRFVAEAGRATPAAGRVLDAGAGDCRHAVHFGHARYFGTDNALGDAVAYDYARLAFVSDVAALAVRDATLDAIVSVNCLEHVAEPARALAEFRRALRPGGTLWLVAPQAWPLHEEPHDYFRFTRYGLERLVTGAGLTVVRITALGGAFWNVGAKSLHLLSRLGGPLLPLAFLLAPLFAVLVPLACFYLDRLDRLRNDTLGHAVIARRPPPSL